MIELMVCVDFVVVIGHAGKQPHLTWPNFVEPVQTGKMALKANEWV